MAASRSSGPGRSSMITTWCGVSATRRPSASFTAWHEFSLAVDSLAGGFVILPWIQDGRSVALPRWEVEMIMKAKEPALGEHLGAVPPGPGLEQAKSVMSKVRSSPGGLWLAWERSM